MSANRPRSLADWLRTRDATWLAGLLRARPDLGVPVPGDMGVLATRLGVQASVGRALDELDAFTLQVLDGLRLVERATSRPELIAMFGSQAPVAAVTESLDRLLDLALVWGDADELHVVGSVRDLSSPYPAGLGHPVRDLLRSLSTDQIAPILATLGLDPAPQPAAAAQVAELFTSGVGDLLATAGDTALAALAQLDAGPPLGQLPDAQRHLDETATATPIHWLLARALLVPIGPDTVELPREVGVALRGARPLGPSQRQPPPLAGQEIGLSTVDKTAAGQVLTMLRHVEQLVEGFGLEPAVVLRSGGLGVRELRRVARSADVSDSQAALYLEIAAEAGLIDHARDATAVWLPTRAFDVWLAEPAAGRWVIVAQAWLAMTRWPALVGGKDDRDKTINALTPDHARGWAPATRQRTLQVLADLPAGRAGSVSEVDGVLTWRAPRRAWDGREQRVREVLAEAELIGILGRGALGSPGRALLGGTGDPALLLDGLLPEPVDHVLVQADLTVVAPGPLEPELAREMALLADVESSGGATVYRIDEATVRRALDAGRSAAQLQSLLSTRSRTPVPQALAYLIDDVARRHGRLRAGTASSYLRCDDESLLAQVLADRRAAALRLHQLAPTVLVSASAVTAMLETLRDAGYAPAAEDAHGGVVLTRVDSRRLASRPRPAKPVVRRPTDEQLVEAVRQLQAGDRAARSARRMPVSVRVPGVTTASTLELLHRAARDGTQVWLGYVDADGGSSQRIVDPVTVGGGFLDAFDHTSGGPRRFALHRVTSAAVIAG